MEKRTHQIKSQYDKLELSILETRPRGQIRGVVQMVHGMCEHKERYLPLMEYLSRRGYACVIHDHRGHGASVRDRRDLGYMYGGGARAIIDDICKIREYIEKTYSCKQVAILGHSMGSLAVRTYLKSHDNQVKAVILCGSPSKNPLLGLGKAVAGIQGAFQGENHRSRLIEALSFGTYGVRFPGEKSRFAWTCSNPEIVKEYETSPLCGFTFTVDAYKALFQLMEETYSSKSWKCTRPDMPVVFMSGQDDPCMGNIRKFKQTVDFMRYAGYRNVRGKIYPGMRHEILCEAEKEKVFHDIYCFLRKKLV